MLRFHGSRDKKTFELIGTNSRLDAVQAAMLRVFLPRLTGWNAGATRGRGPLRGARSRRAGRAPGRRAGPRLPHVRRPLVTARRDRSRARRGRDRVRLVLRDAAPPPACAALSRRSPRARSRRPSERLPRISRSRCGVGSTREQQERVVEAVRAAARRPRVVMRFPVNRHRLWQVVVDAALIVAAWVLSWYVRFEGDARPATTTATSSGTSSSSSSAIMLPIFVAFGFYNRWWRYVSTQDMWGVLRGVVTAVVAAFLVFTLLDFHPAAVPRGIWIVDLLLLLAFVMGVRLLARTLIERPAARSIVARGKEVLIVGAGDAAQLILREMLRNPSLGYTPIGLVDDDPRKKNLRLHGVRVLGTTDGAPRARSRAKARTSSSSPFRPRRATCASASSRWRARRTSRSRRCRACPSSSPETSTSPGRSAPWRWRTSSDASPSRSTSRRSRATSRARSCS